MVGPDSELLTREKIEGSVVAWSCTSPLDYDCICVGMSSMFGSGIEGRAGERESLIAK